MIKRRFPILDRHGPFLGDILDRQIYQLCRRLIRGKYSTVFDTLVQTAIEGLNGVGGINDAANFIRIGEKTR